MAVAQNIFQSEWPLLRTAMACWEYGQPTALAWVRRCAAHGATGKFGLPAVVPSGDRNSSKVRSPDFGPEDDAARCRQGQVLGKLHRSDGQTGECPLRDESVTRLCQAANADRGSAA